MNRLLGVVLQLLPGPEQVLQRLTSTAHLSINGPADFLQTPGVMHLNTPAELLAEALRLFLLAMPVATATWTVTHEEIFREAREYCGDRSRDAKSVFRRKLFYVFTCEYCLSHYVAAAFVALTGFQLLLHDWRGYLLAFLATVGVANVYMSLFGRLRIGIKAERLEVAAKEQEVATQGEGAGAVTPAGDASPSPPSARGAASKMRG